MDEIIREKLNAFITSKKLRNTPQRDAIVEEIFRTDDHFTSEELFERVKNHPAKPSRATVYRALALLVEGGLITEIDLGGSEKTYDPNFHNSPTHNHLICIDCGKVVEFEDTHLETLNDCLTRRLGFRPARQSLRIEACCEKLRASGRCEQLIAARLAKKKLPNR